MITTIGALWAASCGPSLASHNGYKSEKARPWANPRVLEFDESGEAEADDVLSYARRKRANWFAVDLPDFGELEVRLTYSSTESETRPDFDLPFEVLDASYNMLTRADAEEDDAGEETKSRTLYELDEGRYYVHVYVPNRQDAAEFTLRVQFQSARKDYQSEFPAHVRYLSALPAVPTVDDSPVVKKVVRPRCKGSKCGKPKPPTVTVRARISGISATGSGTRIRINKGDSAGIKAGWRGSVITQAGASIPGGGFTVSKVTDSESHATVRATPDAVTSAKYVRLRPP